MWRGVADGLSRAARRGTQLDQGGGLGGGGRVGVHEEGETAGRGGSELGVLPHFGCGTGLRGAGPC